MKIVHDLLYRFKQVIVKWKSGSKKMNLKEQANQHILSIAEKTAEFIVQVKVNWKSGSKKIEP